MPKAFLGLVLPLACAWARTQERRALRKGVALTALQLRDAGKVGVSSPERVRLLRVHEIRVSVNPVRHALASALGLTFPHIAGLTVRYGILIREDCWGDRRLVVHELAHVAQYERLGGFHPFLTQYLWECLTVGYPAAPMEQEVIRLTAEVCRSPD